MRKLTIALLAVPLVAFSGAALAGDAAAGKVKADSCMDCHAGEDFEGMSLEEIIEANRAVLSGAQRHPPGFEDVTEADIPDISAYFYAEAGGK
jgi:cytochrome c553